MIQLTNVTRQYRAADERLTALDIPSLSVARGEIVGLSGPSGSGKTTLINIIAGILTPTTGEVRVNGTEIYRLSEARRDRFRARNIGYIFQSFNLISSLTAWENVMAALCFGGVSKGERAERCRLLLERVGLGGRTRHRPGELSGGEQQRVSIARALANRPPLVLADEPTANLDAANRALVTELLMNLCREEGVTMLLATHDQKVLQALPRVVDLAEGREAIC